MYEDNQNVTQVIPEQNLFIQNQPGVNQNSPYAPTQMEHTQMVTEGVGQTQFVPNQMGQPQFVPNQPGQAAQGDVGQTVFMPNQVGQTQAMPNQMGQPQYNPNLYPQNQGDGMPPKKSKTGLIIGIVVGALVLIAALVIGLLLFLNNKEDDEDEDEDDTKVEEVVEEPVDTEPIEFEPIEIEPEDDPAEGELPLGDITIYDDIFFYVAHDETDVRFDDAIRPGDIKDNNVILGAYAYTSLKEYSHEDADYTDIASRQLDFAYYQQDIEWNKTTDCESVVPVYTYAMLGSSKEFANSTYAYMGVQYSPDENPFYEPTLEKQQKIYVDLIMNYGEELGNEYFANYQKVLSSSFVSLVFLMADPNTNSVVDTMTYGGMYLTDVDENGDGEIKIVDVLIDPYTFEMQLENPDYWVTYQIDMADDWNSYTLTGYNGCSIQLMRTDDNYLMGYVSSDQEAYMGIAGMNVASQDYYTPKSSYLEGDESKLPIYASFPEIIMTDGTMAIDPVVEFSDGNIITIEFDEVYSYATKERTPRRVSISCRYSLIGISDGSNVGFALTDGDKTYYYTYDQNSYFESKLDKSLVEGRDLQDILSALTLGNAIQNDLINGLRERGIEAEVDERTGHLLLANGVMFAVDSSTLSQDGKDYLNIVAEVYESVILSDEYADHVQMISIDGYADPTGDYDHNLVLSSDRARNVMEYLSKISPDLTDKLVSEGHSYDNPIFDEDGEVDYEASRRVEISIVIKMDDYSSSDSAAEAALYGTFIGENYGSMLVIRSGGRGTFTNAGSTEPTDITWYLDGDIIVFDLGFGYEVYAEYDVDTLYLYNDDAPTWHPDTFIRY